MSVTEVLLWGMALCCGIMFLAWAIAWPLRAPGICDIAWTGLFGVLAVFFAWSAGFGDVTSRQWLLGTLIVLWSLRLSLFFLDRVRKDPHDGRVESLLEDWKLPRQLGLLIFYVIQGPFNVLMGWSYLYAMRDPSTLRAVDFIAAAIIVTSAVGEEVSNRQLRAFRRNPKNKGKTCREGLWRYSRHPNYFFQWLFWMAFPIAGIGQSYFWFTLIGPVVTYVLLRYMSGVPATERHAVKSRGDDYRRYQKETSVFFPWFPKKLEQ